MKIVNIFFGQKKTNRPVKKWIIVENVLMNQSRENRRSSGKGEKMGRLLNEDDVLKEIDRWIGYLDEDMITRIKIGIKKIQSAQPEIIRCKDCKYNTGDYKCLNPDSFFVVPADDDFCSFAERREE